MFTGDYTGFIEDMSIISEGDTIYNALTGYIGYVESIDYIREWNDFAEDYIGKIVVNVVCDVLWSDFEDDYQFVGEWRDTWDIQFCRLFNHKLVYQCWCHAEYTPVVLRDPLELLCIAS